MNRKPIPSRRASSVPASPIRKLVPLADRAKARGTRVLHLNIGQPDLETPDALLRRLGTLNERVIAYTPSCGTVSYIDALRTYYASIGQSLSSSEIIATTGGSEAVLFAMLATCDAGDEVLVIEPFYSNYAGFAAMAQIELRAVTSRGEDGFHLPPLDQISAAMTERTRLVILCNPSNPTGTVYREDEIRSLLQLCRERGVFLLSDEVYREFVYDGRSPSTVLSIEGFEDLVIIADSLSKRYSACGLRLGCLVTRNREIYDACNRMAQARLSAPGLAQAVAVGVADLGDDYLEGVRSEYEKRRNVLYDALTSIPDLFLRKPEGAFYFMARLPVSDSEAFAAWLLEEFSFDGDTVMVAPAPGFYATPGLGRDEVRIAYVLEEDKLVKAARLLGAAIERFREAPVGAGTS